MFFLQEHLGVDYFSDSYIKMAQNLNISLDLNTKKSRDHSALFIRELEEMISANIANDSLLIKEFLRSLPFILRKYNLKKYKKSNVFFQQSSNVKYLHLHDDLSQRPPA